MLTSKLALKSNSDDRPWLKVGTLFICSDMSNLKSRPRESRRGATVLVYAIQSVQRCVAALLNSQKCSKLMENVVRSNDFGRYISFFIYYLRTALQKSNRVMVFLKAPRAQGRIESRGKRCFTTRATIVFPFRCISPGSSTSQYCGDIFYWITLLQSPEM